MRVGESRSVYISNFTQPPFFLGLILRIDLPSLFAKISMFIQFLTYRAEK